MTDLILQLLNRIGNGPGESGWSYVGKLKTSLEDGKQALEICAQKGLIKDYSGSNTIEGYYTITERGKVFKTVLNDLILFKDLGEFKFH